MWQLLLPLNIVAHNNNALIIVANSGMCLGKCKNQKIYLDILFELWYVNLSFKFLIFNLTKNKFFLLISLLKNTIYECSWKKRKFSRTKHSE